MRCSLVSVLCAAALATGVLAGCGEDDEGAAPAVEQTPTPAATDDAGGGGRYGY